MNVRKDVEFQGALKVNEELQKAILSADEHPVVYYRLSGFDLQMVLDSVIAQAAAFDIPLEEAIKVGRPAPSCGDTANAICELFTPENISKDLKKTGLQGKNFDLPSFKEDLNKEIDGIKDDEAPLFRLSIHTSKDGNEKITAHDYIIFATGRNNDNPIGYIYQSNIANGMNDNAYSLLAWFRDQEKCKMGNLFLHVQQLDKLFSSEDNHEKAKLYEELYMCTPIVEIQQAASLDELIANKAFSGTYLFTKIDTKYALEQLNTVIDLAMDEEKKLREELQIGEQDNLIEKYITVNLEKANLCKKDLEETLKEYTLAFKEIFNKFEDNKELLAVLTKFSDPVEREKILENLEQTEFPNENEKDIYRLYQQCMEAEEKIKNGVKGAELLQQPSTEIVSMIKDQKKELELNLQKQFSV